MTNFFCIQKSLPVCFDLITNKIITFLKLLEIIIKNIEHHGCFKIYKTV